MIRKKNIFLSFIIILLIICTCTEKSDNFAISSDGNEIYFDVIGKGEPTLVFVHGWSNNRGVWKDQISYFSKKYKTVNIDLAGFGESGNNRVSWNIESFGEDVSAVINKLELDNIVLIGFSMGGAVILETAKLVPDKLTGLVFVDIFQNIEASKVSHEQILKIDSTYMSKVIEPTYDKVEFWFKNNKEELSARMISGVENASKIGWSESLKDFFRYRNEKCLDAIQQVKVPIISINSDQFKTNVEAFKKHTVSYNAKIIRDSFHVVFWEKPEEFNQLLEESVQEFIEYHKSH